ARQLLDRMVIDFAQMIKRSDVDYYVKSSWFATGSPTPGPTGVRTLLQPGNDKIAFYSGVPGYYPFTGSPSPLSLVAYRVNGQNQLERMGKALLWNAAAIPSTPTATPAPTPTPTPTPISTPTPIPAPIVFMPIPIASAVPSPELPPEAATPTP